MSFIVREVSYLCVGSVAFGLCTYSTNSTETYLKLYCCEQCSRFKFHRSLSLSLHT